MHTWVATEHIIVPFNGDGEGVEEMSWGQWEIWLAMVNQQTSLPIGGSTPLAEDTTLDDAAEELRYLMNRFPTLRTRLGFARDGRPRQILSSSGVITLEVFDAASVGPAELARLIHEQYAAKPFDYSGEWPVRMAVIRHEGVLTHLVAVMCHLTMDGIGGRIMLEQMAARPASPPETMQPLEQARWQRSSAGQRHNAMAMRHWSQLLRSVPIGQLNDTSGISRPRYWEGQLRSRALHLAVQAISARVKVDSSAALLGLYSIALAQRTGMNPVFTRPVVSNRFRPGLSNVVCMLAQAGLFVIDVAGLTVDEAIARTQALTMTAYKYAYFDPEQLKLLLGNVAREREPEFTIGCFYNDRRVNSRNENSGPLPVPADLAVAKQESTFRWLRARETPLDPLFLHVEDTPGLIELTVAFDTHHISPDRAEGIARTMEEVAIAAAFDPSVPAGVRT